MSHGIIIALATLDLILGILLYVTIRQIQTITAALDAIDKKACEAAITADHNDYRIDDMFARVQICSRGANDAYRIATECRNELTRQHMNERNDAWKEKLKPSRQPSEESKG